MGTPVSIFAVFLFVLALPLCAQQQPSDTSAADSLDTGSLTFWVSCKTRSDAEALAHSRAAALETDYPDLKVQYKAFMTWEILPAMGAAGKTGGEPPDIVYVDNAAIEQVLMNTGATAMVGKPRVSNPGSWLITGTSSNPKLARAFILWLEQPPPGKLAKMETQLLSADDTAAIRKAASAAVEAFGSAHKAPGIDVLDKAIANFAWEWAVLPPGYGHQQSFAATTDIVGGNQRLAFAEVAALDQGDNFYGLRHASVILRKQETAWQVLLLQPDESYPEALKLLQNLDTLKLNNDPPSGVAYLSLLAPMDQAKIGRYPHLQLEIEQEGEFGSILAIESQFNSPTRRIWSPVTATLLHNDARAEHILRVSAPFTGTPVNGARQTDRWRVWSINQSGAVTLSDWRVVEIN